ncbi:MAG: sulfate adenylyltransferase subunit CysN [Alphaproteobacteria bacterium]|nr:MAG: sulfate adenylyltransferase subunit CysN [Alphaproteobacteria bacterium]
MKDYKTINFLTCGHVDDGKSTLIGRLLYDIDVVPDDHIEAARNEEGEIDYALFTDGLEDERRQGITIDVAHRYFRYEDCRYRIADTPGHLEYMRNMAVAAVTSDVAVILVDAIHGVRLQTVEYSKIAKFFGVRQFLVAINKMDAVDYSEAQYNKIKEHYLREFGAHSTDCDIEFVPVSALLGDNIVTKSDEMPWYKGKTIMEFLKKADQHTLTNDNFRLPIQHVIKDEEGTRWYGGTLHGKSLTVGDSLTSIETEQTATVTGIYHSGKSVEQADKRQAIAISLAEDIDLSRGAVLSKSDNPGCVAEAFHAEILWIDKKLEGKESFQGMMKMHHSEVQAQVAIEGENGVLKSGKVYLSQAIAMDPFDENPHTGLFILIDPYTERVAGVGTVGKLIPLHYQGASAI